MGAGEGVVIDMEKFRRLRRIDAVVDRIDRRGSEMMDRAIGDRDGVRWLEYVAAIKVLKDRCIRVAAMADEAAATSRRRTA